MYKYFAPFLFIGLTACHSQEKPVDAKIDSTAIPTLQTLQLKAETFSTQLQLPGELRPFQTVDLYAKVSSFVKMIHVDVGSQVSAGQLLAELEAPELDAQLKEAQSTLHTKEATFAASRISYERLLRTSRIPGTISPNDLDNAYAKMSGDSSDLMAARSRYEQAQAERQYLVVKAPFNGVISSRNVYSGAYVGPAGKGSDLPMLTLQEQSRLRLVIAVPEAAVKGLSVGDNVEFGVKPIPGKKFYARVSRMSGSMNTTLRTEQVEMDVDNRSGALLPGMYAQVQVTDVSPVPTYVIPATAVAANSQSVFVIAIKDHRVSRITVQKGRETTDSVEVYGRLAEGDTLAIRATDELRDGMQVKIPIL